jgi:hypothetical protein
MEIHVTSVLKYFYLPSDPDAKTDRRNQSRLQGTRSTGLTLPAGCRGEPSPSMVICGRGLPLDREHLQPQFGRGNLCTGWRHSFLLLLAWHAVLCAHGHLGSRKGASVSTVSVVPHAVGAGGFGQGCGSYPARHHHGRDRQDRARGHHRGGRIPVSAQLPQLPQVDLHVSGWSELDCINRHEWSRLVLASLNLTWQGCSLHFEFFT